MVLDAGKCLGRSYEEFTRNLSDLDDNQDKMTFLKDRLQDICLSINAADYFDLKVPIVNNIYVDLPPKGKALYNQMERELFIEISKENERHPITALNAIAKSSKCLQIANGAVYFNKIDKRYANIHDAKIQVLEEILEESGGMPLLVAYNFQSDLDRLLKAFPKGKHLDKDPDTIKQWNAGKIPLLFAHPASAGHGLNLQDGSNIIVFFGHNWNLEHYQQMIERIGPVRQLQSGYNRPVFIHHIIARDTIDEMVMTRRETKREIQDILLKTLNEKYGK